MYEICVKVVDATRKNKLAQAKKYYSQLEKISVETAITDKAKKIAMSVSNHVGWSDLGKWHVIKRILGADNKNLTKGDVIVQSSHNNLVYSTVKKKIVAINDVKNLVIVDTDDALFISSLKNSADVKKIVDKLKENKKDNYL